MCLTRIYCRRKRDGMLFRFNSRSLMRRYSRDNDENRRTLPVIDRTEFIRLKRQCKDPQWVHSIQYVGMATIREER